MNKYVLQCSPVHLSTASSGSNASEVQCVCLMYNFCVITVSIHVHIFKVGQNHMYTMYIRYSWQGSHQVYGHIRCVYMVLANPTYICFPVFIYFILVTVVRCPQGMCGYS
jgi:hypothetical protein